MGTKLKELRLSKNITQEELAKRSGVSRITIANIESGKSESVLTATLAALADALEVSVAYFFA